MSGSYGPYRSLLVSVDDQRRAVLPLLVAAEIATGGRGRVAVLASYAPPRSFATVLPVPYFGAMLVASPTTSVDARIGLAHQRLRWAISEIGDTVLATCVVHEAPTAVALVERARAAEHDLILLPKGELSGERLIQRYRARRLARRLAVDVLLVGESGFELFCMRHAHSRLGPFGPKLRRRVLKAGVLKAGEPGDRAHLEWLGIRRPP